MTNKEYKVYSFRLNDNTYKLLKELKSKNGKSWNLFIYEIINYYKDK